MTKTWNRKAVKNFTDNLWALMIEQKISLGNTLEIMKENNSGKKKSKVVSEASEEIIQLLKSGCSFAKALEMCSVIEFDGEYAEFIRFAEKTGNLEESVSFLKKKCERKEENIQKIGEAVAYPLFVMIAAVVVVIFLFFYARSIGSAEALGLKKESIFSGLKMAFIFVLTVFGGGWYFVRKNLGSDKLYEAFLAAGFLVKNGESFGNAISIAAEILGKDSWEGKWFKNAGEKLKYGFDLKSAFENPGEKRIPEIEEAFFYAGRAGGKTEVFEKIADKLNLESERKRNICLKLIEPMFIAGTGGFLLIFLMNTLLPLLSGNMFGF